MFIGCMGVLIGQTKADEDARNVESVVHLSDEGDGAALADEHGFLAEAILEGRLGNVKNGVVISSHPGFTGAEEFKFASDGFGQELANVFFHQLGYFLGLLIRNQAGGEFCISFRRNDSFGAFALVTAPDSVELEGRPDPQAFDSGESFFTGISRGADGALEIFFLPR